MSELKITTKSVGHRVNDVLVNGEVVGTASVLGDYVYGFEAKAEGYTAFKAPRLKDVKAKVEAMARGESLTVDLTTLTPGALKLWERNSGVEATPEETEEAKHRRMALEGVAGC